MGCDIHLIVQERGQYLTGNGYLGAYWSAICPPTWWPRDEYDQEQINQCMDRLPAGEAAIELAQRLSEWYGGRSYLLFAHLAGVRGHCKQPIAEGRGLPKDRRDWESYDLGEHSFTWCTVQELLDHEWPRDHEGDDLSWWRDTYVDSWQKLCDELHIPYTDMRLVFGFDS